MVNERTWEIIITRTFHFTESVWVWVSQPCIYWLAVELSCTWRGWTEGVGDEPIFAGSEEWKKLLSLKEEIISRCNTETRSLLSFFPWSSREILKVWMPKLGVNYMSDNWDHSQVRHGETPTNFFFAERNMTGGTEIHRIHAHSLCLFFQVSGFLSIFHIADTSHEIRGSSSTRSERIITLHDN